MFKTVVLVAFLVLAAGPAFAQAGSTQSPPAPNAASAGPEPTNSLPPGAANMGASRSPNVSGNLGTTTVAPRPVPNPANPQAATVPTPK